MLLGAHPHETDTEASYSSAHNYYERLVFDQISRATSQAQQDHSFIADVACVALNRLPPRYVRHDVDMTFFLSPIELEEILDKVAKVVNEAITYVDERNKQKENSDSTSNPH